MARNCLLLAHNICCHFSINSWMFRRPLSCRTEGSAVVAIQCEHSRSLSTAATPGLRSPRMRRFHGVACSSNSDHTQQQDSQQQQQDQKKQHTTKQKVQSLLQQHGPGAFLSYITVSNFLSVGMLSSAWLIYTRTTGFTPLQAGQWSRFLVFYAGAYAMTHIARPLKLAIGLAGTPVGSAAVDAMARVLHSSKNVALVVLLVLEAALLLCCLGGVVVYGNNVAARALLRL